MSTIIAFANQKGGVGKTTSAVNIAADLGCLGKKTLLVDCDPQGNASSGVGAENSEITLYDMLFSGLEAKKVIQKTKFKNLDVIPSDMNLAAADIALADEKNRESKLKVAFDSIKEEYDYIILDCPPSLSLITLNALTASNYVVVPMQCEYFALEGLSQLVFTIKQVRRLYNPNLDLLGVILTMYDGRLNLTVQVMEEVKKHFPGKVFRNSIPRNVRLSEAPSHSKPINYYDKFSRGALNYMEVARELIERAEHNI
ncbi:MAG: ParA family protein [Ruminococcaceae bacterium]|nr:ParA family protein [Oscillospiraceae bacterium]